MMCFSNDKEKYFYELRPLSEYLKIIINFKNEKWKLKFVLFINLNWEEILGDDFLDRKWLKMQLILYFQLKCFMCFLKLQPQNKCSWKVKPDNLFKNKQIN